MTCYVNWITAMVLQKVNKYTKEKFYYVVKYNVRLFLSLTKF